MATIHPTALVDPRAQLADDVEIGAYAIVRGAVRIGAGTVIHDATHVHGPTQIGSGCRIGPAAFVGLEPQHLGFDRARDEEFHLVIGNRVIIREGASVHRATHAGVEHATRVDDGVFLMGASHVGHDCHIESNAILANGVLLGGHCRIGARSFLGGGSVFHQFVRVGRLVIVGGNEPIAKDILHFGAVKERKLKGYNAVGCRRAGLSRQAIASIREAYRLIHEHRTVKDAALAIADIPEQTPELAEILHFIANTKRGLISSLGDSAEADD